MLFGRDKTQMPTREDALVGRETAIVPPAVHFVSGAPLDGPFDGKEIAMFGLGCFWGAERAFWTLPGVFSTQVGYAAGFTPNPTYEEVCSGRTGHNEVVRVVFDPDQISYRELLRAFFEGHNPTQGMRQGNDRGTQYRSGVYTYNDGQADEARAVMAEYQRELSAAGHGAITTEIEAAGPFYFAEEYHQQYLAKNPGGYCGLGGTGVSCPIGLV